MAQSGHVSLAVGNQDVRPYDEGVSDLVRRAGWWTNPGIALHVITELARFNQHAPTVAFTLEGYGPRQIAERLGREAIFV